MASFSIVLFYVKNFIAWEEIFMPERCDSGRAKEGKELLVSHEEIMVKSQAFSEVVLGWRMVKA